MSLEDRLREFYEIPFPEKLHHSSRFYKRDSETEFCVQVVFGHTCTVVSCNGKRYDSPEIVQELHSEDTGKYSYPQIIRNWTGRNIVWKFERSDYYD